jgi:uncharacterized damage-inducible protein DinB
MKIYCKQNLEEIKQLVLQLSDKQYDYSVKLLSNTTIGQHVRHILEFYQSILNGLNSKIINYDNRKRNLLIETDKYFAVKMIDIISSKLAMDFKDIPCVLEGNFSSNEGKETQIKTTVFRELAYCLEHSIHHQALIKVGLLELNSTSLIDKTFGLAPATIRYKKVCAQ